MNEAFNLLGVYPELPSSVIFDPCNENNLVEVKESPLNIIIQKKKEKKKIHTVQRMSSESQGDVLYMWVEEIRERFIK